MGSQKSLPNGGKVQFTGALSSLWCICCVCSVLCYVCDCFCMMVCKKKGGGGVSVRLGRAAKDTYQYSERTLSKSASPPLGPSPRLSLFTDADRAPRSSVCSLPPNKREPYRCHGFGTRCQLPGSFCSFDGNDRRLSGGRKQQIFNTISNQDISEKGGQIASLV